MSDYQLYVSKFSPYSMKAAAGLGWAGLEVDLVYQTMLDRYKVLKKMTGETMVPVLRRDDWAMNDSTDILAFAHEKGHRPLYPDGGRRKLALILEDFFDEWVVRIFGLTRWLDDSSKAEISEKVGEELTGGMPIMQKVVGKFAGNAIAGVLERGGLTADDADALLASRTRLLEAFEYLFGSGRTIFGGYPSVVDFAFYGFFNQMRRDVSGEKVFEPYPAVREALDRLHKQLPPAPEARLFKLTDIQEQDGADRHLYELHQLFAEFLGTYWRVLVKNVQVRAAGSNDLAEVKLIDGRTVRFKPRGYLVGRLRMILEQVDAAYAAGEPVFGNEGLRMEAGLIESILQLADGPGGAEIVADYTNIPLYPEF